MHTGLTRSRSSRGRLAAFVLGCLGAALLAGFPATARSGTEAALNTFFGLPNVGVWDPPDANGACGPRGILHVNNDGIKYLTKSGSNYYQVVLREFFPPPTPPNILNDPRGIYDPQSERFFVTCSEFAASGGPSNVLHAYLDIAVSTSSHPTQLTDWVMRQFEVTQVLGSGAGEVHFAPDYPTIGIDAFGLHICGNFTSLPIGSFLGFQDVGILTFPKSQLLAAGPVTPLVSYLPPGDGFTLQPVSVLWSGAGPGDVSYFVETPPNSPTAVRLWALQDPLGTRTLSSAVITVPDHGSGQDDLAPQLGTSVRIRTWSGMAQGVAQWCDGTIRVVATGDTSGPGLGGLRTRVHYYALAANGFPSGTPTLSESAVIDGGLGVWNFLPALGITPRGDIAIEFQQSSDTLSPRMMYSVRPLGSLGFTADRLVMASAQSFTFPDYFGNSAKWGDDYTGSADPADSSIWLTCELARAPQGPDPRWIHEWANVIFDDNLAGWPAGGRRVRQGQTHVEAAQIAGDDSAGVYLGWLDSEPQIGGSPNIRASRLLPSGPRAGGWTANGTFVFQPSGGSTFKRMVADGTGGAYFVFVAGPVSVMRLGRTGIAPPGWPASPVQVASPSGVQLGAASDGAGGLLVAYIAGGVKVQRVGPTGALLWSAPPALASSGTQLDVVADPLGGAYVAWVAGGHARVQHVLATGVVDPAWPGTGFDCGPSALPHLVADGAGGLFVCFYSSADVFARRLLPTGVPAPGWAGAFTVCNAAGAQDEIAATSDGSGGVLVAWSDQRSPATERDIYAQRVTGSAQLAAGWPANGLALCTAPGDQSDPAIVNDGTGGAVVVWTDDRSQPGCSGPGCGSDCYWSRTTAAGVVETALGVNGAALSADIGDQSGPAVVLTGSGSAIAAWLDGRSTPDGDPDYLTQVYAQRIQFDVTPPAPVTDLAVDAVSCTALAVRWTAPGDDGALGTASTYDLRYSTAPINSSNFSSATRLPTEAPGPAGSLESYTYEFGHCSGSIYFALVSGDDVHNLSGLSDLPLSAGTACAPAACDSGLTSAQVTELVDALGPPRPNPSSARLRFEVSVSLASAGRAIDCSVFDVSGRLLRRVLADPAASAGRRTLEWDLRDGSGRRVRTGLFFVRMRVGDHVFTRGVTVN